jgi:pilus assembly protein TadC
MTATDAGTAVWAAVLAVAALAATWRARRAAVIRARLAALPGERRADAPIARLRVWRRTRGAEDPRLPLATELLAACLAAGAAPGTAAAAVGGSLDGPLAERLRRAASELRLGADPGVVWGRLGRLPGAAGLARRLELAGTSGAPAVAAVTAEAAECRARRRRTAQIRARRAAVQVTGPLGLCFLPAFLLIGVAPVIIGMARELL